MKASSFFTTVLAFAAAAVARAQTTPEDSEPKRLEEVPDGYTLAPMTWKGNITAEGPEVAFTGANFKDIDDQIHQANPDFTWPEVTANDTTPDSAVKSKSWLTCDPNNIWWAQEFRIEEGVAYLRGKSGHATWQPARASARASAARTSLPSGGAMTSRMVSGSTAPCGPTTRRIFWTSARLTMLATAFVGRSLRRRTGTL